MLTLAAYVHAIDPYAIEIIHGFGVRWYGLSYLLGFFIGWLLIRRVVSAGHSPLSPAKATDLVLTLAIGIVAGGRLGYVLFYKPDLLIDFSSQFPFWGLLRVNQGGMASHGGILGGIAASWLFAYRNGVRWAHVLDLMAFGGPLGLFFGRIANFINGELYGRRVSEDFPLAVKFPQEMYDMPEEKLRSVYSQLAPYFPQAGVQDWITLTIEQIQKGNEAIVRIVEPILTPRHPSQIYAGITEGLVTFAVLLWVYRRPVKPGTVGGWFCIVYGVMRIFNEFFRMPDAHLLDEEFAAVGVTRGQWLSVLLVLLGVVVLWLARRHPGEKQGGWLHGRETEPADGEGSGQ